MSGWHLHGHRCCHPSGLSAQMRLVRGLLNEPFRQPACYILTDSADNHTLPVVIIPRHDNPVLCGRLLTPCNPPLRAISTPNTKRPPTHSSKTTFREPPIASITASIVIKILLVVPLVQHHLQLVQRHPMHVALGIHCQHCWCKLPHHLLPHSVAS